MILISPFEFRIFYEYVLHESVLLNHPGDVHNFELQLHTPVFESHWPRRLHEHRRGKQNCFSAQFLRISLFFHIGFSHLGLFKTVH